MTAADRPVLLVTSRIPPERVGAFRALAERVPLEIATFEGRDHHFSASVADSGLPVRRLDQRAILRLAGGRGRWRAVIAGSAGRVALPAAWAGARSARTPFVLWSALWHEPATPAFRLARPLLRRIVRDADAIAVYGPHVADHVRALGGRRIVIAPQAVDPRTWVDPPAAPRAADDRFRCAYVGRDAPGKGLDVLREAWPLVRAATGDAAELVLIGPATPAADPGRSLSGVRALGPLTPAEVRAWLDRSDVLCVPSVPTPAFLEPWGLVCNEALHRGVPVVASDAVGAAAGGLVRDGRNGRVVAAGDPRALAAALAALIADPTATRALSTAARADVAPYTFAAWADAMVDAVHCAEAARADRRPRRRRPQPDAR